MSESNQLVSIVIPIYNVENYLEKCLQSAMDQSYRNIEIIALNDGSPDHSAEIIDRFAAIDPRIKHVRQENQGIAKTRINAMEASTGDYILHLDGDDFLAPNFVELMLAEALQSDSDMVYCDAYRWITKDDCSPFITNPHRRKTNNGIEYFQSRITTFIWGKLFRREVVLNLRPQRVNVNDDLFLNLQILPRCKRVSYLPQPLYYYRSNPTSIMHGDCGNVAAQYLDHGFQRRELDLPEALKKVLLYDNIIIILRYLKFWGMDEKIKPFIDITYREYSFFFPKSFKEFKIGVFLFLSKFCPKLACFLIR